ncbi:MAG: hypothetical protein GEV07_03900 [Streptosporangiales bacterium]|nr:hypothetical protein [Streptosporangiales bacterium]
MASELDHLGVRVSLGTPADAATLRAAEADVVIMATGAEATAPRDPAGGQRCVTDVAVFDGAVDVPEGESVVVYDRDAGIRGGLVAVELAERGARVRLVTPLQAPCQDVNPTQLPFLRRTLTALGVEAVNDTELLPDSGDGLRFRNVWSKREVTVDGSLVVFAGIAASRTGLLRELDGADTEFEVRAVGDCVAPRTLRDAVREGALAGAAV